MTGLQRSRSRQFALVATAALATTLATLAPAGNVFTPEDQPFGTISAPTTSRYNLISGNETVFAAWFEKDDYSGDLLALPVGIDGSPKFLAPRWRARTVLATQDFNTDRNIVTSQLDASFGDRVAVAFDWSQFSDATRVNIDPSTASDSAAVLRTSSPVANYIRGDRSEEQGTTGSTLDLRPRQAAMGDIVHSNPVYVGLPTAGYSFDNYLGFAAAHRDRAPRVYVGGNDGMLHAFDASGDTTAGREVFAYVPSDAHVHLRDLVALPYRHRYFVDGPIVQGDVYYGPSGSEAWHSVLVSGLGAGGRSYIALDVTDPDAVDESAAAAKLLWEFRDPNLGFSYAKPEIVRLQHDDTWVLLAPNGYLNGPGDGKARLFAVDMATGTKLGEIPAVNAAQDPAADAEFASNGLSSIIAIDKDDDFRADIAYAGDMNGNVWKFDLSGSPASWDAGNATLLFSATDAAGEKQSITTRPEAARHPDGGLLVYVATGQFLSLSDVNTDSPPTQTVYGLYDRPATTLPLDATTLVRQVMRESQHASGVRLRVASNFPKDDENRPLNIDWSTVDGWAIDLPVAGERTLNDPVFRDNRLQLVSVNPLLPSGENWLMSFDYLRGGAPSRVVLDIDGDGALSTADNIDYFLDGDRLDREDRAVGQYQSFGLASGPLMVPIGPGNDVALINHLAAIGPIDPPITPVFVPPPSGSPADIGIRFGHFDLDTSTDIYRDGSGSTNQHQHEWDDNTGLTSINLLDIPECTGNAEDCLAGTSTYETDTAYDQVPTTLSSTQQFVISVINSDLSPGGILEINGGSVPVTEYEDAVSRHVADSANAALPVFQLGSDPPSGVQQLSSLKLSFDANAIFYGGLIGTSTGCVKGNDFGPNGEYRNGALTVQIIDANRATRLEPDQHYAVDGNGTLDDPSGDGLLWETTVFWHWDGGCYGSSSWQENWDACYGDTGNICNCIKEGDFPLLCSGDGSLGGTSSGGDGSGDSCTVTDDSRRYWELEFDRRLCSVESGAIKAAELEFEFEKDLSNEAFTVSIVYSDGSSKTETLSFSNGDTFTGPSGYPLQIDATELNYTLRKVQRLQMINAGPPGVNVQSITLQWTDGHSDQKLKKVVLTSPRTIFDDGLSSRSPAAVPMAFTLAGSSGDVTACEYTLAVAYEDAGGTAKTVSIAFDESLDGVAGTDLEIDLTGAELDSNQEKVLGVLLHNTIDSALSITGATLSWQGAVAGQAVKKIKDDDDGDLYSGTLPSGESVAIAQSVGIVERSAGCPTPPEPAPDPGAGGIPGTGVEPDSGGSTGGTEEPSSGVAGIATGDGGFISRTVMAGNNALNRLLWRELTP